MTLSGPSRAPASGDAKSVVVFLHGYGADGADLIGLADVLAPALPDTQFYSPDAPERCAASPFGRQWFPISWIDGSSEDEMRAGFEAARDALGGWLDALLTKHALTPDRLALVGFSQGTMMALSAARRRAEAVAGVVGFSGRMVEDGPPQATPPVLLAHGDLDEVIPVAALEETRAALAASGHAVNWHVSRGVGHGIAPDGLALARDFLTSRLQK